MKKSEAKRAIKLLETVIPGVETTIEEVGVRLHVTHPDGSSWCLSTMDRVKQHIWIVRAEQGLCGYCGAPESHASKGQCEEHRLAFWNWMHYRRGAKPEVTL